MHRSNPCPTGLLRFLLYNLLTVSAGVRGCTARERDVPLRAASGDSRGELEVPPDVVVGVVARVHLRDLGERRAPDGARVHPEGQALVARLVDGNGHEVEARDEARLVGLDAEIVARAAAAAALLAEEDGRRVDGEGRVGVRAALADSGAVGVLGDTAEDEVDDGDPVRNAHGIDGGGESGSSGDGSRLNGTDESDGEGGEGEEHCGVGARAM